MTQHGAEDICEPMGNRLRGALVQEGNSGTERGSGLDLLHGIRDRFRDDPSIEEESDNWVGNEAGRANSKLTNRQKNTKAWNTP